MIYKFKVLSEEDDKFFMDIEIRSDQTFYDLHELIQDELEYDNSHLATFFIANHNWQRKQEIPLLEVKKKSAVKTVIMDKAVLSVYMKDAHQKLIYLFDFINERSFYIELMETKAEAINRYYPICIDFGGEIPPQFGKKSSKKLRIFEDEENDVDIFSAKKAAPIIDEDFEEDFAPETFDKDMQFEIDDDALIAGEEEEEEPEEEKIDDEEDPDDE
jgi:hypothetical protein